MATPTTVVFVALTVAFGLAAAAAAWRAVTALHRLFGFVAASAPSDAGDGELVRLRGEIGDVEADASAPVSGTSCVGYLAVLEQPADHPLRTGWRATGVAGRLPRFAVHGDHGDAVTVDLTADDAGPGPDVGDADPPGSFAAPLQLAVDARSDEYGAGERLPDDYAGLPAKRDDAPARVREHRVNVEDGVLVAGRLRVPDAGPPVVDHDALLVLADDPGVAFLSLVLPVVAWSAATAGALALAAALAGFA